MNRRRFEVSWLAPRSRTSTGTSAAGGGAADGCLSPRALMGRAYQWGRALTTTTDGARTQVAGLLHWGPCMEVTS